MHNIKTVVMVICCIITLQAYSQIDPNLSFSLPNLMVASPEAASLGKFGQIPVSAYTGIPNINIPLYTIKEGEIQLPLSIDYHAGGIKVEEMASCVGLGWALNAGGVITRVQRGQEDFQNLPRTEAIRLYQDYYKPDGDKMSNDSRDSILLDIYYGAADGEADLFYYNFGGISGKFFLGDDGNTYTMPRTDLKIEWINGFVITTGQGIKYKFQATESNETTPYSASVSSWGSSTNGVYSDGTAITNTSAWYLTEIDDTHGNSITFTYTTGGVEFKTKSIDSYNLLQAGYNSSMVCPAEHSYSYSLVDQSGPILQSIHFSNGMIYFRRSYPRLDQGGTALQRIDIYTPDSTLVKAYRFYNSYFNTSTIGCGPEDDIHYRLRLDSLREMGGDTTIFKPAYQFSYNATQLPCRLSNAQDHWGYYNGQDNSTFASYQLTVGGPWLGANKEPDSNYVKAGMLEQITYPTGGNTHFTYEPNQYTNYVQAAYNYNASAHFDGLSGDNTNNNGDYLVTFQKTINIPSGMVPDATGYALLQASISTYVDIPADFHSIIIQLTSSNGYSKALNDQDTLHLTAGTYTLSGSIETEFAGEPYANFDAELYSIPYVPAHYENGLYGGVRVRSIQDNDALGHTTNLQRYKYNPFNQPDSISSGIYIEFPSYSYNKTYIYTDGVTLSSSTPCPVTVYNSFTNYPLLSTNGQPMGYKNVTVYYGNNGENGKKEMTFTTYADYPDIVNNSLPFPPADERDWRRGLLTQEVTYANNSGVYTPVVKKSIVYTFHTADTTHKSAGAVKLAPLTQYLGAISNYNLLSGLVYANYLTETEAFNMSSDTTITYDQHTGQGNSTVTAYQFSNKNFQLSHQSSLNSNGDYINTTYRYALDYVADSNSNRGTAIYNLQQHNIVSQPVEIFNSVLKPDNNEYLINGKLSSYGLNGINLEDTVYAIETASPTLLSSYTPSYIDISNNLVIPSQYKPKIVFNKYLPDGNPSELSKVNDVTNVYVWDYHQSLPVAIVKNADSASVAYTSFEADGTGNWVFSGGSVNTSAALTGKKSYTLSSGNSITKTGLNSSLTYIVSYWSNTGAHLVNSSGASVTGASYSSWVYYEHHITGASTIVITGSGSIDELRLYPGNATMVTSTYDPLVGITDQCDASSKIIYYEYDSLGRLKLTRDQYGNIVKRFDYQYHQPY